MPQEDEANVIVLPNHYLAHLESRYGVRGQHCTKPENYDSTRYSRKVNDDTRNVIQELSDDRRPVIKNWQLHRETS